MKGEDEGHLNQKQVDKPPRSSRPQAKHIPPTLRDKERPRHLLGGRVSYNLQDNTKLSGGGDPLKAGREWLRVSSTGKFEIIHIRGHDMRALITSLRTQDLRVHGPLFANRAAILGEQHPIHIYDIVKFLGLMPIDTNYLHDACF